MRQSWRQLQKFKSEQRRAHRVALMAESRSKMLSHQQHSSEQQNTQLANLLTALENIAKPNSSSMVQDNAQIFANFNGYQASLFEGLFAKVPAAICKEIKTLNLKCQRVNLLREQIVDRTSNLNQISQKLDNLLTITQLCWRVLQGSVQQLTKTRHAGLIRPVTDALVEASCIKLCCLDHSSQNEETGLLIGEISRKYEAMNELIVGKVFTVVVYLLNCFAMKDDCVDLFVNYVYIAGNVLVLLNEGLNRHLVTAESFHQLSQRIIAKIFSVSLSIVQSLRVSHQTILFAKQTAMAVSAEQTTINALASLTSLLLWFIRNLLLSLYDFLTSPSKLKVVLNNTIIHDWICRIASCEYLIQPLHVLSNQKGIQLFDECLSLLTIILSDFQISVEGVLQIEELIDKMQPSYRTNSQVDHSDRTIEIYLLLVAKQMVTPAILRTAERISKLQIIVNNSFTLCTAILDSFRQPLQLNAPSSPAWNQSRDIIYTNLRDNLQKILGRAFISKAEFRGSVIVLAKSLVEYEERSRFLQNRKGHKQYIVHMSKEMKEQSCSQSLHSEPENISERQLLTVEIIQSLLELLQLAYEDGSQVQLFGLDLLLQIAYTEAYELPLRTCLLRSPHRQSLETLSLSPNPKINQKIYQLFQVLEIE